MGKVWPSTLAIALTWAAVGCAAHDHGPGERRDAGGGGAMVKTSVNSCPIIESVVVAPLRVSLGERVHLDVEASDPDGDELSITWGTPSAQGQSQIPVGTAYECLSPGPDQIVLTVSDGLCDQVMRFDVVCI